LVRALVETAARDWEAGHPPDMVPAAILRQGAWRASRWGTEGELLHPVTHRPDTARNVVDALHRHVREALDDTGDAAYVAESLQRILDQGTGASRQRQAFERNSRLSDVVTLATGLTHQEPVDNSGLDERFLEGDRETISPSTDLAAVSG
jgi:carboxylate-amine ligase